MESVPERHRKLCQDGDQAAAALIEDLKAGGLTYRYAGRDFRLTDVHGRVVHDIIG